MKVKQCDREAAHELIRALPLGARLILQEPGVFYKAFAKHRAAGIEEAAQFVKTHVANYATGKIEKASFSVPSQSSENMAAAIRALIGDDDEK